MRHNFIYLLLMVGLGQEETMNRQHNKENDGGLGSNALGGEIEPKSKRIKLDDPNIQPVKRNQVDDEEAHSHSSTRERPFERKSEEPFVPFLEDVEEPEMSAFDYMMSQLRPKWQQELAKRGARVINQAHKPNGNKGNEQGTCRVVETRFCRHSQAEADLDMERPFIYFGTLLEGLIRIDVFDFYLMNDLKDVDFKLQIGGLAIRRLSTRFGLPNSREKLHKGGNLDDEIDDDIYIEGAVRIIHTCVSILIRVMMQ
ncbi:hypothetical protein LguiA_017663 [Lonicera macranthoides]